MIYESILSNNFFIILPLFGADYDIVRISSDLKVKTACLIDIKNAYETSKTLISSNNLTEKDPFVKKLLAEINIRIYHPFDKKDFYIKMKPEKHKFKDLMKILNILTLGTLQQAMKKYGHDKVCHLALIITLESGKRF